MTLTQTEMLDQVVSEVSTRYRFSEINALIPKPRSAEMRAAVFDALQEINAMPPVSHYTLDQLFADNGDPRVMVLLYLATAKNILHTLIFDYTANGFSQTIGEFSIEDKLEPYKALYDTINTEFTARLQPFKESSQKVIKGVNPTNQSALRPYAGLVSLRRPMRY